MASYTDAIAQFNPYVQQLPVELMAKVGMAKQAQYDAGIQKVQSYIDNVAGVDVVHDADKAYLQSKLGQLGNKLKSVAAGDFSNQQLVSSVGGMTTQIVKDPIIQEAIASTSYYKKGNAAMEEARKKGEIGASNAYVFNKQAQEWLSNPEAGAKFRGVYTPYRDVNKKVIDVISKIHSNANLKDIGYVVNPDGTMNTDKILDALHKQGYEGVTEQQIRTVLSGALDAGDLNQLSMDGAYNLRSYGVDKLAAVATKDYEKTTREYVNRLEEAKKQLLITNSPAKIEQLNQNIKYYEEQLGDPYEGKKGGLTENYENILKTITEDPDAARGRIHTKNYIDQIANGFAWAHVKDEIATNPIRQRADDMFWKNKEYSLNVLKFNHQVADDAVKNLIAQGHLDVARFNAQREADKDRPDMPYFTGSGDAPTDNLESYRNFTSYVSGLETENAGTLSTLATKRSKPGVTITPDDIKKAIDNGTFKPATNDEIALYDQYIKNKNIVANQRELLKQYENEAASKITGGLNLKQAFDKELGAVGNIKIGNATFSAKEVYDFLKREQLTPVQNYTTGTTNTVLGINKEGMTDREKLLYSKLGTRYTTGSTRGGTTGNTFIDNYLSKLKTATGKYQDFTNKVNILVAEKLAPTTGVFRTEQAAVTFGKDTDKDKFITNITNLAKANLSQKTAGANHDPENMISLLTNKTAKDVDFQLRRSGNKYFVEATDKNDPSKVERMEVTATFVAQNPSLGSGFMNKDVDLAGVVLANGGSTNIFKDYRHAYYQNLGGFDANQNRTVTLPVRADLERQSNGDLNAVFRVKTKNGEIPITIPNPVSSRADFEKYLSGLTDDVLLKLLKSRDKNIEQIIAR